MGEDEQACEDDGAVLDLANNLALVSLVHCILCRCYLTLQHKLHHLYVNECKLQRTQRQWHIDEHHSIFIKHIVIHLNKAILTLIAG